VTADLAFFRVGFARGVPMREGVVLVERKAGLGRRFGKPYWEALIGEFAARSPWWLGGRR